MIYCILCGCGAGQSQHGQMAGLLEYTPGYTPLIILTDSYCQAQTLGQDKEFTLFPLLQEEEQPPLKSIRGDETTGMELSTAHRQVWIELGLNQGETVKPGTS